MRMIHIIPYDGIGGVEAAARSLPARHFGSILFEKCFLVQKASLEAKDHEYHGRFRSENDPRAYIAAANWIVRRNPEVVIASLWRSCVVLILVKLLRPKIRTVTFLHLDRNVHWFDRILNGLAMRISTEIWADSQSTLTARAPDRLQRRGRVISMRTHVLEAETKYNPDPTFVFWGRLHTQKGLGRSLRIFSTILAAYPEARFNIIGPDGGEKENLERQIEELGLQNAVQFLGAKSQEEVHAIGRAHSFYLQTSEVEGLAMSVAEAMQLGLVPVVTPVGEIAKYCRAGENAIMVTSDEEAVLGVLDALEAPLVYQSLSKEAAITSMNTPLYKDDVLAACRKIAVSAH